ncbi:pyridoxal phosphate-dependent aminotransferase [Kiloniella laminariae]|uniref:Aminotransferase n=1 Tax=Kiloniella laminariae TaxID=454162 RepID=A0ABT4LG81_9PROT|nr:pyridoxal phosphate-dependent aminotransferase [Kiloniella laminariae]MCZ4280105.1 pyridoxal phosphate-dependent aminotransferase [Kiloniella laminariae]
MVYEISRTAGKLERSHIRAVMEHGFGKEGVIPLWFGESDEPTPEFIKEAGKAAIDANFTTYPPSAGLPVLRKAISRYMTELYGTQISDQQITVAASGMQGVMLSFQCLLNPGDKVKIISPIWPNAANAARLLGADVSSFLLQRDEAGKWSLNLERLFSDCDAGCKLLYLNSPNNPTGWVATREELVAILDYCRKRGIWLVCDDVYGRMVYEGKSAPSVAEIMTAEDQVILLNSFSKAWNMTGWRLGWITAPPEIGLSLARMTEFNISGAAPFIQKAGVAAIEQGEAFIQANRAALKQRRDLVCEGLAAFSRVTIPVPEAAFYAYFSVEGVEDPFAYAIEILDKTGVGIVPGSAFAHDGPYFRMCFACSPGLLSEALTRLEPHLNR